MSARLALLAVAALIASACGGGVQPAPYDASYVCANCRMTVSDVHFAAQVAAPGEEPRFYDDIGCLAAAMKAGLTKEAVAFVADHRTGAWVKVSDAVFTRVDALATPMGSHLVAHASPESRDADPAARDGRSVAREEALGEAGAGHAR